jgi:aminopeptidase YwaD
MTKTTYDEAAASALRLTAGIIERRGPRLCGTKGCRDAAAELEGLLEEACGEARREAFPVHPGSLFSIGKVFSLSYAIGLVFLFLGSDLGSAILLCAGALAMLFGAFFCASQFVLYLDLFDPLFKKVEGSNVVGSLEPSGPVTRQVIVVAHLDSAPVYSFHEKHAAVYPLRLFLPIALFILGLLALSSAALSASIEGRPPALPAWITYALVLGLAFVAPMYSFMSGRSAPGAGDDLIGCAIGIEIARLFRNGAARLESTRIVILLADGEEAGQKGSKHYVSENYESLTRVDTTAINIDNVYDYEDLGIIERDRNGFTPLSGELARELQSMAAELGHEARLISIPLGGGGTDAAQFARRGIRSAGIMADSTKAVRKEIVFHTMADMPDRIQAEAVGAVIEILCEYVAREDARPGDIATASLPA